MESEFGKWVWIHNGESFARVVMPLGLLLTVRFSPVRERDDAPWSWYVYPASGGGSILRGFNCKSAKSAQRAATMATKKWLEE